MSNDKVHTFTCSSDSSVPDPQAELSALRIKLHDALRDRDSEFDLATGYLRRWKEAAADLGTMQAAHAERCLKVKELTAANDALINALVRAEDEMDSPRITRLMDGVAAERQRGDAAEARLAELEALLSSDGREGLVLALETTQGELDQMCRLMRKAVAQVDPHDNPVMYELDAALAQRPAVTP